MPILDVEVVTRQGERLSPTLDTDPADALGEVFGAEPALRGRIAFGGKLAK